MENKEDLLLLLKASPQRPLIVLFCVCFLLPRCMPGLATAFYQKLWMLVSTFGFAWTSACAQGRSKLCCPCHRHSGASSQGQGSDCQSLIFCEDLGIPERWMGILEATARTWWAGSGIYSSLSYFPKGRRLLAPSKLSAAVGQQPFRFVWIFTLLFLPAPRASREVEWCVLSSWGVSWELGLWLGTDLLLLTANGCQGRPGAVLVTLHSAVFFGKKNTRNIKTMRIFLWLCWRTLPTFSPFTLGPLGWSK